jgi:MFS family permease
MLRVPPEPPVSGSRAALVLLIISVWVNYFDRGSLSVAAPALALEFGLTPVETGVLLSAFFWTYAGFQIPAGWLVDRCSLKYVYAGGFALWTGATLATTAATGFAAVFWCRIALGLGESVAYPAYARFLASEVPESRRGFANALVDVGTKAGPGLSTLAGGLAIAAWGWRPFFLIAGAAGLLWLLPWLRYAPASIAARRDSGPRPSIGSILRRREGWATCGGLLFANYVYYFLLAWLPSYLRNERKFSLTMMAIFGALPYAATAVASLAGGWWADRRIRQGRAAGAVRRSVVVTGLLLCMVTLPLALIGDDRLAMAGLVLAFAALGICTSNLWALTQTLAGPEAAGRWTGVQNAVGNIAGVVAPALTGFVVERTGAFAGAFALATLCLGIAAIFYSAVLGRAQPVDWAAR